MNRTEDDLRAVYVDPPGVDGVARRVLDSIANAEPVTTVRRRRTSLRTWTAAGASAAAVAAVTVTAVLIPHRQSNTSHQATTAQRPPAVGPTAAPPVPVTPQVAVQNLISLLPRAGTTTQLSGTSTLGWVGGELVYDDGHGAAELAVGVSFPFTSEQGPQRIAAGSLCASPGVDQLHEPCQTLPDGSQVAVYQGDANIPGGAKDWEVSVLRTDGVQVDVTEWNSPVEKGGAQTRSDPPFTTAELTTIARSSTWQASVDSAVAQGAAGLFVATSTP